VKVKKKLDSLNNSGSIPVSGNNMNKKKRMETNTEFKSHFEAEKDNNCRLKLEELAGNIAKQGEKLYKKADLWELKIYRNMIADFISIFVNGSHRFSKQSFLDRKGRHRVYVMIRTINADIEEIAKELLKEEKENIQILKNIDDIKGLILDLIL